MLDFEEFSDVWHFIVTGEERPASVETVTDSNEHGSFLDALKGVLGDYLVEEVDGGDQ